jgi:hypothetical protein
MEETMDFEQVKTEILKAAEQTEKEKMLTCHDARALAEKLGVDYATFGRACDEAGIKVRICELGCF